MDKIKKVIKWFDILSIPLNIFAGLFIGYWAAKYSWRILSLMVPHMFFISMAIYFKTYIKNNI
jgi:uncharacterized protein YneF (UPF0154 family)